MAFLVFVVSLDSISHVPFGASFAAGFSAWPSDRILISVNGERWTVNGERLTLELFEVQPLAHFDDMVMKSYSFKGLLKLKKDLHRA